MKIAVSASAPDIDTDIDPRFGRCQYLVLVDPDTMDFEVVNNSGGMGPGGAGIATAQLTAGKNVGAVITGNCGPNAYQVLAAAGIKVVTGVSGKIKDAVESYKAGKLQPASQPNVAGHFGMGRGGGMDRRPGRGGWR
jgi:predicted Fe-Mo cluster-binding NifX family protein